jgi:hypothetical protein
MALLAKKPEIKEKRLKMFVYGPPGVGKTVAALQFPNAVVIDTEKGTDFYAKLINQQNSVVFQSNNSDEIRTQIKELLTTNHQYTTLIIDPMTQVYNAIQEKWTRIFEKYANSDKEKEVGDFGMRYWGKVKGEMKSLQRLIMQLDMNVIITSHQKDVYGPGFSKMGVTYDSMKGEDYLYDLVFHIVQKGKERFAETIKERAVPGEQKFPEEFSWSYENFLKFYGSEIIKKEATPIKLATPEQVERAKQLVDAIKVPESQIEKWFNSSDVEQWDEMKEDQILKCLGLMEQKIMQLSMTGAK